MKVRALKKFLAIQLSDADNQAQPTIKRLTEFGFKHLWLLDLEANNFSCNYICLVDYEYNEKMETCSNQQKEAQIIGEPEFYFEKRRPPQSLFLGTPLIITYEDFQTTNIKRLEAFGFIFFQEPDKTTYRKLLANI